MCVYVCMKERKKEIRTNGKKNESQKEKKGEKERVCVSHMRKSTLRLTFLKLS